MAFDNTGTAPAANEMFGWNDEVIDDGSQFENKPLVTLPEGDYEFKVVKFTKAFQKPSANIPNGCNKAELILKISGPDGDSLVNENLFLMRKMEWKLSSFLRAIGQKKHGEACRPDWNKVYDPNTKQGATGRAHFKVEEYVANDGTTKTKNVVDKYLDPSDEPWVN